MAQDVFAAVANPVRRRVLELLLDRPRGAGEIAGAFDLGRPAVSEHLQVLRKAGLVTETPRGRERYYSLDARALRAIRDWIGPFEAYRRAGGSAPDTVLDTKQDP